MTGRGCWRHKGAPTAQCSACRGASETGAPGPRIVNGGHDYSLGSILIDERAKPPAHTLTREQSASLAEFTVAWNRALTIRGLSPVDAQTALTEGLRALAQMTTEGAEALERGARP